MILLTHVLRKTKARHNSAGGEKINHILLMDNLNCIEKSESEIKGLVFTVAVFRHTK